MEKLKTEHTLTENYKLVQTISWGLRSGAPFAYTINNSYSLMRRIPRPKIVDWIVYTIRKKFNVHLLLKSRWCPVTHNDEYWGDPCTFFTRNLADIINYLVLCNEIDIDERDSLLVATIPPVAGILNAVLSKYDVDKKYEMCSNSGELKVKEYDS